MAFIARDASMTSRLVNLSDAYWFQEGPGVRNWQFQDSGVKLLNVANITKHGLDLGKTNRHLSVEEVEEKYSHFLVDAGDMVIASSGISIEEDGFLRTRGAFVNHEHLPLCMNTSTIRFKAMDGISSLSYLRHWIDSMNFRGQISRLVTGSAQKNFGPSHLKQITIPLPPLEVQKRIASILDAADALRAKRRESLRKLEVLLKSVFLEMFGDPVTNPKNYPTESLGEICDVRDGTHDSPKYTQTGLPLVTSKNLVNGKINLSGASLISEKDFHEINRRSKVDRGDILMPMIGTIGNPVIVEFEPKFAIKNVALFKFTQSSIHPIYIAQLLSSSYFDLYLLKNGRGGTQKFLSLGDIRTIPIPIPTKATQEAFEVFWKLWKLEKERMEASLASLETLFSSLQDQAFNGTLESTAPQLVQLEVQTSLF
jgi:type I restriction enzyme, S subunit